MRLLLATLVVLPALLAQDPPAPPVPPAPPKSQEAPAPNSEALVDDLGSADFQRRSDATEKLRALGESARPALEKAKASENLEQKTRVQSLLSELEAVKEEGSDRAQQRGSRLRPEQPGSRPFRVVPGLSGEVEAFPRSEDFPDPNAWMEAIQRHFNRQRESTLPGWSLPGVQVFPGPGLGGGTFSFSLGGGSGTYSRIIEADGERLELTRKNGGAITLKTEKHDAATGAMTDPRSYEAPDLKSFEEQYPEVWERYRALGIFEEVKTISPFGGLHRGWTRVVPGEPIVPDALPAQGRVLGVVVGPVPEALRAHVQVPASAVIVETVSAGSAAEKMGLRPWDIITHIDGTPVGDVDELRSVLHAETASPDLTIKLIRKSVPLELKGERPQPR